jgi:hypothetical protein
VFEKCRDPLVSLRHRLNGARSLASHARDSCSATHRWPEHRHGRRPRAVALILAPFFLATMTQGRSHSAIAISHCLPAPLSRRALLSPLRRLAANVVPPPTTPSCRQPCHSCASFLLEWGCPQATAPTVTAAKATPEQAEAARLLPPWEARRGLHVFGHPWPRYYATELRMCAAILHVPSANAFDHRFIPLVVVPHRWPTPPRAVSSSETLSSRHPKSKTPWPGLGPRPIPHQSSATDRPDFAGDRRRRGRRKIPSSWLSWAERPYGPDGSCRRSPMAQCDLFFSIRFIHFNIQIRI